MRDFRYAVRLLLKSPAFTLVAVTTLSLCIGANTAIYTVVDRVLLRALPYPHPERLAMISRHYEGPRGAEDDLSQSGYTWVALREGAADAIDLAAWSGLGGGVNLVADGRATSVPQQRVSAGYFRVLGVAPELGREFTDEEDRVNGPAVAVVSHALWVRAFNADRAIVGRSVTLRGEPHVVVGVMPAAFNWYAPVDIWTPLRPSPTGEGGGENYGLVARLKDGVSWPQATNQIDSATAALARERYRSNHLDTTVRFSAVPLQRGLTDDSRRPLFILWGAVGVVLLIGCVNIAGLLVARGIARRPEIAMRIALGGSRGLVVRQLLTESVVLAVCGGVGGLAIGFAVSRLLASWLNAAFGVTGETGLDARVLAITSGFALLTSVAFGLLPALQATRVDLRSALVDSGGTSVAGAARSWPRQLMVAGEIALGVVLLVAAGLLVRSFGYLMGQRPGFDSTHVMTATVSLQDARYRTADGVARLFDRTLERIRTVAGVERAAAALTLPYERALNNGFRLVGSDAPGQMMNMTYVTPEFFDALRIPVVRGRVFTASDAPGAAPVIVVNQAFVRKHSPDEDPIGRQIQSGNTARTIVGVVGDVQQKVGFGTFGPVGAAPASYVPVAQISDGFVTMVHTWFSPSWIVRLSGPQEGIVRQMQQAVESVDPLLPVAKFRTLDEVRGEAVATPRAQAQLLGTLAGLALLLAAVGLYGLVASSVAERTRELGIRLALGATSRQAIAAAAMPGLVLAGVGVVVGGVAARLTVSTLRHLVWGVSVADPLTFIAAIATVLGVALIATLVPALRIARLNPIKALR
jgi:putative ABC transport system permease protein